MMRQATVQRLYRSAELTAVDSVLRLTHFAAVRLTHPLAS
jgi:hypothetical protein